MSHPNPLFSNANDHTLRICESVHTISKLVLDQQSSIRRNPSTKLCLLKVIVNSILSFTTKTTLTCLLTNVTFIIICDVTSVPVPSSTRGSLYCMCNNPFPASAIIMTTETANLRPQLKRTSFIVFVFGNASTTEASTSSSSTSKEEIELNLVPTGERRSHLSASLICRGAGME